MRAKVLLGKRGDDPEWVQDIASFIRSEWKDEYEEIVRELFYEYKRDGLSPTEAWKKAKRVIDCFEIGWTISEPYLQNLVEFLSELTWVEYNDKKQKLNSLQKSYFQGDDEFKEMCNVIMKKTSLKKI